jgi:hypothetical protein
MKLKQSPPNFVQAISDKPAASPVARVLAKRSSVIANRCHQNVRLSADATLLLTQLNGEEGHEDLLKHLAVS